MVSASYRRVLNCAVLTLAVIGCSSAAAPPAQVAVGPAQTPLVIYASPAPMATATVAPTPTSDPEAIRKSAGTAYLAAAATANGARNALNKKYTTIGTVTRARAYVSALPVSPTPVAPPARPVTLDYNEVVGWDCHMTSVHTQDCRAITLGERVTPP
jgi:hypothetical protein